MAKPLHRTLFHRTTLTQIGLLHLHCIDPSLLSFNSYCRPRFPRINGQPEMIDYRIQANPVFVVARLLQYQDHAGPLSCLNGIIKGLPDGFSPFWPEVEFNGVFLSKTVASVVLGSDLGNLSNCIRKRPTRASILPLKPAF